MPSSSWFLHHHQPQSSLTYFFTSHSLITVPSSFTSRSHPLHVITQPLSSSPCHHHHHHQPQSTVAALIISIGVCRHHRQPHSSLSSYWVGEIVGNSRRGTVGDFPGDPKIVGKSPANSRYVPGQSLVCPPANSRYVPRPIVGISPFLIVGKKVGKSLYSEKCTS